MMHEGRQGERRSLSIGKEENTKNNKAALGSLVVIRKMKLKS
jgi:hypothetical protein